MKYVVLLCLLIGCGKPNSNIAPEALKYYEEFYKLVGEDRKTPGVIVLEPLSDRLEGVCYLNPRPLDWKIVLNSNLYHLLPERDQRTLVFHELTHCVLGVRKHALTPRHYMGAHLQPGLSPEEVDAQVLAYLGVLP